jgi:uncharacterized protein YkwD
MHRSRLLIAAVLAVSVTGCGSAGSPPSGGGSPHVQAAPGGGALRVTTTDGRVGDATRADAAGASQLRVPSRIVDPATLRGGTRHDGVDAAASCTDVDLAPTADNVGAIAATTLCLLNGERAAAGLQPLKTDDQLATAAIEHSQDMVANQYFDHQSLDGRDVVDRIRATGYIPDDRRWTVGENLAWGTGPLATPKNIVAAWMASQGHRENILRAEYREIGFGIVVGNPRGLEGGGATYTTNFGAVSGQSVETRQVAAARRAVARRRAARRAARHRRAREARTHRARAARARRSRAPLARIALGRRGKNRHAATS